MDKIDDQQINYFFGRDGVKNIKRCAENAQKILKEMFRDWVGTIHISEEISKYAFGDNVLFVNFNYTDTLLKRFGVKAVNEFHIHGMANEKESIIVGHATHPKYPYEPLRMFKNKPRMEGVYYIEEFLYNSDKHIEDNYMKLQIFCGLHGVRIENIKKIFVLGLGFGDADLGYIKHLIYETQGISENPETYLEQEEKAYLDSLDYDGIMHINMQYAVSHRERVMQKKPISFPEYERLDEMIKPYVEDPYQHVERDVQLRLEAAGVRRRFQEEQEDFMFFEDYEDTVRGMFYGFSAEEDLEDSGMTAADREETPDTAGTASDIDNIQWYLTDNELAVIFNRYDIAGYAFGPTAVKIPFETGLVKEIYS